jgi:hypothetical protein
MQVNRQQQERHSRRNNAGNSVQQRFFHLPFFNLNHQILHLFLSVKFV